MHDGMTLISTLAAAFGLAGSGAETHSPVAAHDRALALILTERELIAP